MSRSTLAVRRLAKATGRIPATERLKARATAIDRRRDHLRDDGPLVSQTLRAVGGELSGWAGQCLAGTGRPTNPAEGQSIIGQSLSYHPGVVRRSRRAAPDPLARAIVEAARHAAQAAEAAGRPEPVRLGLAGQAARAYAEASRSSATRRAYRTAWQAFCDWCSSPESLSVGQPGGWPGARSGAELLPASPDLVAAYVAWMAQLGRSPSTVEQALAAISVAHQAAGHPSPTSSATVRAVASGIRRAHGAASRGKAALETSALRDALAAIPAGTMRGLRDRAMLLLGFAGGLRRSELVGLDLDDVEPVAEGLRVHLRRSKTDQEGRGRLLGIPWGLHEETCPVRAVRAWVEAAGAPGTAGEPLFRTVDRAGRVLPRRCSDRAVARAVQRAVRASGGDPGRFGAHSLRSGFVTSAARAGAPTWAIQLQTGHRSLAQLHHYVRPATLFQENAARYVGL